MSFTEINFFYVQYTENVSMVTLLVSKQGLVNIAQTLDFSPNRF